MKYLIFTVISGMPNTCVLALTSIPTITAAQYKSPMRSSGYAVQDAVVPLQITQGT